MGACIAQAAARNIETRVLSSEPIENNIDNMYYSPPVQPEDYSQPPLAHVNQVINPVLYGLVQAQAGLHGSDNAGKFHTV